MTRAQTSQREPLGLTGVLAASLPDTLMTDLAPERYTVEAVFTRRPEREELDGILGTRTQTLLTSTGFPGVTLNVSDRRLEIANTTLEELRGGLANVIADRLAEISAEAHAWQTAVALQLEEDAAAELVRTSAVNVLAASVRFRATGSDTGTARPQSSGEPLDDAEE